MASKVKIKKELNIKPNQSETIELINWDGFDTTLEKIAFTFTLGGEENIFELNELSFGWEKVRPIVGITRVFGFGIFRVLISKKENTITILVHQDNTKDAKLGKVLIVYEDSNSTQEATIVSNNTKYEYTPKLSNREINKYFKQAKKGFNNN